MPLMNAMLVIADPLVARELLSNTKTFVKGDDYTKKFSVVFGEGLVTSNGERHKHDRACLGKYFAKYFIDKQMGMFCSETRRMMDEDLEPNLGKERDLQHFFHILSLRIFCRMCFSIDLGAPEYQALASRGNAVVIDGSKMIGTSMMLRIPIVRLWPQVRRVQAGVRWIDALFSEEIEARKAARRAGQLVPDDILGALMDDKTITKPQILAQLRTLMSAGHDTTAFFGCYMAFLLASHPAVQDKLKAEVATVLGGQRADLTPADLDKLKYCRMVMQESLRLYSVIPVITRTAIQDYVLKGSGRVVPKGTVVLFPLFLMSRDPGHWEAPSEFRPERFKGKPSHTQASNGYLPFAYGSRTCIGNTLALTEGTVFLALLMQRYRFHPAVGFKPKIAAGVSLTSTNGVVVRVEADPL